MNSIYLKQREQWCKNGSSLPPSIMASCKWIVLHQRIEFFVKILFVVMKTEMILDEHIFDQIWITYIYRWIKELVIAGVWNVGIVTVEHITISLATHSFSICVELLMNWPLTCTTVRWVKTDAIPWWVFQEYCRRKRLALGTAHPTVSNMCISILHTHTIISTEW